jgi:hypothetical protein
MGGRSSVGPRSWAPWMGERRDIAPWLRARGAGSSPGPTAMEDVGARRRGARLEVAERCSACCCREGEGEWRGGEEGGRGLPFIEPNSGHVRLHQQVAGAKVSTLGGHFWRFLLGIGSRLL